VLPQRPLGAQRLGGSARSLYIPEQARQGGHGAICAEPLAEQGEGLERVVHTAAALGEELPDPGQHCRRQRQGALRVAEELLEHLGAHRL